MVEYRNVTGRPARKVPGSEVFKAIHGAPFPTDKRGLFEAARGNGAPGGVLNAIDLLPEERPFANALEVARELDRVRGEPHVP